MPTKKPDLMTVKEVAEYLRCEVQAVRRYAKQGKLESVQIARKILIPRASVEALISRSGTNE